MPAFTFIVGCWLRSLSIIISPALCNFDDVSSATFLPNVAVAETSPFFPISFPALILTPDDTKLKILDKTILLNSFRV